MKFSKFMGAAALALTFSLAAKADNITVYKGSVTLSTANSTELGRNSRSGVPQDWYGTESYTGQTATTTAFYYQTITLAASLFTGGGYLDITTFEPANTAKYFITAYANSYDPNNRGTNWLGDAGFSGNYQTNDGGDFQVILPAGDSLVLLINSVGQGLGGQMNIQVDNYADNEYTPVTSVAATPEPSSLMLVGTGLVTVAAAIRRRMRMA